MITNQKITLLLLNKLTYCDIITPNKEVVDNVFNEKSTGGIGQISAEGV